MNSSTKGIRRAALLALALAVIVTGALATAAPCAVQQQADTAKDARPTTVSASTASAPPQVGAEGAGTVADRGGDGESGTTDGDPDVPLTRSVVLMQILIARVMLLTATIGI